jgi:hypothetical protein
MLCVKIMENNHYCFYVVLESLSTIDLRSFEIWVSKYPYVYELNGEYMYVHGRKETNQG